MKTQMRFQKIIALLSLIIAALVFVYALYFLTGSPGRVAKYIPPEANEDMINGQDFFDASQSFVDVLTVLGIIFILSAVLLYVMGCQKRRNYYLTNYIAVGIYLVIAVAVIIYMIIGVSNCMNLYLNGICWDSGTGQYGIYNVADQFDRQNPLYKEYINFILGYVVCVLVLARAGCLALSTALKYKLMKGEKQLLQGATVAEPVKEEA